MEKEGPTDYSGRFHPQSLLIYSNYNTLAETVRNIFKNEVNINSWTFEKNYIFEHVDLDQHFVNLSHPWRLFLSKELKTQQRVPLYSLKLKHVIKKLF